MGITGKHKKSGKRQKAQENTDNISFRLNVLLSIGIASKQITAMKNQEKQTKTSNSKEERGITMNNNVE